MNKLSLLLFLLANVCHAKYQKHVVEQSSCGQTKIKLRQMDESVVLESSPAMVNNCSLEIEKPPEADGLVVVARNLSIDNSLYGGCGNYIQFGSSSSTGKWCKSSDKMSLVMSDPKLKIEINLANTSDTYFNFFITPFKKSVSSREGMQCRPPATLMCRNSSDIGQICISEAFKCDGRDNCPEGYDEDRCQAIELPNTTVAKTERLQPIETSTSSLRPTSSVPMTTASISSTSATITSTSSALPSTIADSYLSFFSWTDTKKNESTTSSAASNTTQTSTSIVDPSTSSPSIQPSTTLEAYIPWFLLWTDTQTTARKTDFNASSISSSTAQTTPSASTSMSNTKTSSSAASSTTPEAYIPFIFGSDDALTTQSAVSGTSSAPTTYQTTPTASTSMSSATRSSTTSSAPSSTQVDTSSPASTSGTATAETEWTNSTAAPTTASPSKSEGLSNGTIAVIGVLVAVGVVVSALYVVVRRRRRSANQYESFN